MEKPIKTLLRTLRRARLWLRVRTVQGDEKHLGLLEMILGRKYYFVVLHDEQGDYLCSTFFLFENVAKDYAFREGGYVISERYRTVYRRVISTKDTLAGFYRPSFREMIDDYGQ